MMNSSVPRDFADRRMRSVDDIDGKVNRFHDLHSTGVMTFQISSYQFPSNLLKHPCQNTLDDVG